MNKYSNIDWTRLLSGELKSLFYDLVLLGLVLELSQMENKFIFRMEVGSGIQHCSCDEAFLNFRIVGNEMLNWKCKIEFIIQVH